MNLYDKKPDKNPDRIVTMVFVLYGVCFLFSLTIAVGVIWAAIHFISKYW